MSHLAGRTGWALGLLAAGAAAAVALAVWLGRGQPRQPPPREPFPPPPYSASRFLNTGPDARYVGRAACAECHPGNYRSYLLTAHSRSLADLDPNDEPPDGSFHHEPSGRSYRVYRRDGRLRQEEVLRTPDGRELSRVDVPVRYRIGSGNVTRSYLVESDWFLHESPVTWYTSRHRWDMSPGYDFPHHWGFDRPVSADCLVCHAGRAEAAGGTLNRITFHEQVIGCENCHGPGSPHEALRRGRQTPPAGEDLTIVNPGKLSRPLLEAVCAECHLNGPAAVTLRGRRTGDFRPGRPLTDYRIDYRFEGDNEQMTVVGHLAQLRRSACYQHSDELTCLTCHDPHAREKPKDPVAFYRQRCLSCHDVGACGLGRAERLRQDPADNCVACHMPRGNTEMPHIAFTNHRIVRRPPPKPAAAEPGRALLPADSSGRALELVPAEDVSWLTPLEQRRNLGLAYHAAFQNPVYRRYGYADTFRERARELLEGVDAAGLCDPEMAAALAELCWAKDRNRATAYARRALREPDLSAEGRVTALLTLAGADMQDGEFESASRRLEQLVVLRRAADDWYLLGECYLQQGQPPRALPALEQALAIRPDRADVHVGLAEVYRRLGDLRRADEHREKARGLSAYPQD